MTYGGARAAGAAQGVPQLRLRDLSKRFGGVRALEGANLEISHPGVVHGLIGQNGSGKSTLLGILSGQLRPDSGAIEFDGKPVTLSGTVGAIRRGVVMVSQETELVPDLSVAENILLGGRQVRSALAGVNWRKTNDRARGELERLGLDYDPDRLVRTLRPDQRQMVEIARALSLNARILILDEPTSSLTDDEAEHLFGAVRRLRDHGVSTVFVSHRLDELLSLSDEITVLRDGKSVAHGAAAQFDAQRLTAQMLGREPGVRGAAAHETGVAPAPTADDRGKPPALRLAGVHTAGGVRGVDLDVCPGEIVGLAGLVGAGRSELLEAVFGLRPLAAGEIFLDGDRFAPGSPRESIARGIGFVPPDRKGQGLVLQLSIADNLLSVATRDAGRLRSPEGRAYAERAESAIRSLGIRAPSADAPVGTLSGGNQQKVALGKWVLAGSKVLLLDNPTRGVDVAAKDEIHELLRNLARGGAALIVSSGEPEELIGLCDRIVVLVRGRVAGELSRAEATLQKLTELAGGINE